MELEPINAIGTITKAHALVLSYGDKWTLSFQVYPWNDIILEGEQPTKEEIIEVLSSVSAPDWLIQVIEICAAVAERAKADSPKL